MDGGSVNRNIPTYTGQHRTNFSALNWIRIRDPTVVGGIETNCKAIICYMCGRII
jgi:hypothetical protein